TLPNQTNPNRPKQLSNVTTVEPPGSSLMQAETTLISIMQGPERSPARPAAPRRLWIAVLLLALFWVPFFLVSAIDKPYFYCFLYSMASAAVLVLLFSVWWWTNRGLRWSRRFLGFVLVVGTGLVIGALCHSSMWFALPTVGLPAVLAT